MTPIHIPIRNLMTPVDDGVEFMPMPRAMSTFEMPRLPEPGPGHDVAGAHKVLQAFVAHFGIWLAQGGEPAAVDLVGLPADILRVINETLGEGEVSAIVTVNVTEIP